MSAFPQDVSLTRSGSAPVAKIAAQELMAKSGTRSRKNVYKRSSSVQSKKIKWLQSAKQNKDSSGLHWTYLMMIGLWISHIVWRQTAKNTSIGNSIAKVKVAAPWGAKGPGDWSGMKKNKSVRADARQDPSGLEDAKDALEDGAEIEKKR